MSGEPSERPARGPQGDRGPKGEPGMSRGARLGFTYLSVLMLALAAANLLWTSRQVGVLNAKTSAQCQFDADLGGAPVTVSPRTGRPAVLAVSIVSDARVAWRQTGCPGALPPPDPSFLRWAAFYRLPAG